MKNPMTSGETVTLELFFLFNDTQALLGVEQLDLRFSVRDGGTQQESGVVTRAITLEAISEYFLAAR